ncbi:NAD(P)-dependent oxidoreductase [Longispora albida]|uniref:NAD(P)-dependent oxidoreductase n=1 Tax=Longispora albida TaxID=203523 RepID=UPI000366AB9E|nr:NAD(P)-dependent oxidoreductase [Longispora albida]
MSANSVIGIVSPGYMGSGLALALHRGGARVVATVAGRSARTARLAEGMDLLPSLDAVVEAAGVILVVIPPAEAVRAATEIAEAAARTGARPLVVDMNAISPSTVNAVAEALNGLDLVDGSISGPPPSVADGTILYFSGPRAAEVTGLPWTGVVPTLLGPELGTASAVKMCTASVYKGTAALYVHAMVTAQRHGVLDAVLNDLTRIEPRDVAKAATKAHRYVGEMHEIATTQAEAGLSPALFTAIAETWSEVAKGDLAQGDPESIDSGIPAADVATRLLP